MSPKELADELGAPLSDVSYHVNDATRIAQMSFADLGRSLDTGKLAERPEHAALRYPMDLDEDARSRRSREGPGRARARR
jgi:hypothetical protein